MDEALLEKLRESSGLRLDKEGRFWHRGTPIEHARTVAALHQGIHRAPNGRWATRIGKEWGYLDVEDAALFVRRIDGSQAQLASGEWAEIESLSIGADDALYARVRGERARLTRGTQFSLASALREENGSFEIDLAGTTYRVSPDTGPEPVRSSG
ncbi:MAG: hypothetical protein ABR567_05215 [Myxococcales bacterium]|nr:hypothetical protein [Myxococcales bacterium]